MGKPKYLFQARSEEGDWRARAIGEAIIPPSVGPYDQEVKHNIGGTIERNSYF